jgi:hypothetical protein
MDVGSPLDRAYQRELLLTMRAAYPDWICTSPPHQDEAKLLANLAYLGEHGLCDNKLTQNMSRRFDWHGSKITASGLDFLEEDGGLSAILGVVTVRLHSDTIRELIGAKIDATPLSEPEKSALKKHLATLSEAAWRTVTTELVKSGLNHMTDIIPWLQHTLSTLHP